MPCVDNHSYLDYFAVEITLATENENICLAIDAGFHHIGDGDDQATRPWGRVVPPLWCSRDGDRSSSRSL